MRLINRPTWTPDGREIIFSAATESGMGLWRIAASGASRPRRLVLIGGGDAWSPTLSRDGTRLVYERRTDRSSIWRVPLGQDTGPGERITSSTRNDSMPSLPMAPGWPSARHARAAWRSGWQTPTAPTRCS
jgi:Tol biopolymer transport system component